MHYFEEGGKTAMEILREVLTHTEPAPYPNAKKVIEKAISFLYLTDDPLGSGCIIFNEDYYGKKVTGGDEYGWCVTYVWDIFRMCGLSALFYEGERVDECSDVHQWGEEHGLLVGREDGRFGDIVLFDWNKNGTPGHVGFILGREHEDGRYITLEGNTSDGKDSIGGRVRVRLRRAEGVYSIIRPGYHTPDYT